ncbi:thioredoxin family protein [bacterium]|nr:thioredoxin family protein [bacterium]
MSDFKSKKIFYLEDSDFTLDWKMNVKEFDGKNVVVMVQGGHCGFCTDAKPDFKKLAENHSDGKLVCCTIQLNGKLPTGKEMRESQKRLAENIAKIVPDFKGVPVYVKFKNGKGSVVDVHTGSRDTKSLLEFAKK